MCAIHHTPDSSWNKGRRTLNGRREETLGGGRKRWWRSKFGWLHMREERGGETAWNIVENNQLNGLFVKCEKEVVLMSPANMKEKQHKSNKTSDKDKKNTFASVSLNKSYSLIFIFITLWWHQWLLRNWHHLHAANRWWWWLMMGSC